MLKGDQFTRKQDVEIASTKNSFGKPAYTASSLKAFYSFALLHRFAMECWISVMTSNASIFVEPFKLFLFYFSKFFAIIIS